MILADAYSATVGIGALLVSVLVLVVLIGTAVYFATKPRSKRRRA